MKNKPVDFYPEWMTYADISLLTDVPVNTLRVWRVRKKLPEPDLTPNSQTPLWRPETIRRWNEERSGNAR
jgi:hypothetical protein